MDELLAELDAAFAKKFSGLYDTALEVAIVACYHEYDTYHYTREKTGRLDRYSLRSFAAFVCHAICGYRIQR